MTPPSRQELLPSARGDSVPPPRRTSWCAGATDAEPELRARWAWGGAAAAGVRWSGAAEFGIALALGLNGTFCADGDSRLDSFFQFTP